MKKFKIVEEVLDTSWHRYYYEVPANTKEEAVEMVKEGDVDCYDSEELFEFGKLINECRGTEGERIKHVIPTVNGYHLITSAFDRQQFSQKLALNQLDPIDIHDNNPTLLYYKPICGKLS